MKLRAVATPGLRLLGRFTAAVKAGPFAAGLGLTAVVADVEVPVYGEIVQLTKFPLELCLGADLRVIPLSMEIDIFLEIRVCLWKCFTKTLFRKTIFSWSMQPFVIELFRFCPSKPKAVQFKKARITPPDPPMFDPDAAMPGGNNNCRVVGDYAQCNVAKKVPEDLSVSPAFVVAPDGCDKDVSCSASSALPADTCCDRQMRFACRKKRAPGSTFCAEAAGAGRRRRDLVDPADAEVWDNAVEEAGAAGPEGQEPIGLHGTTQNRYMDVLRKTGHPVEEFHVQGPQFPDTRYQRESEEGFSRRERRDVEGLTALPQPYTCQQPQVSTSVWFQAPADAYLCGDAMCKDLDNQQAAPEQDTPVGWEAKPPDTEGGPAQQIASSFPPCLVEQLAKHAPSAGTIQVRASCRCPCALLAARLLVVFFLPLAVLCQWVGYIRDARRLTFSHRHTVSQVDVSPGDMDDISLQIGSYKGGSNILGQTKSGPSSVLRLVLPKFVEKGALKLYVTVTAKDDVGNGGTTHCVLDNFDVTVPEVVVTQEADLQSHRETLRGTYTVRDDSMLAKLQYAVGLSPGESDEVMTWKDLPTAAEEETGGDDGPLQHFRTPINMRLLYFGELRPISESEGVSEEGCALECLLRDGGLGCKSFDYSRHEKRCFLHNTAENTEINRLTAYSDYRHFYREDKTAAHEWTGSLLLEDLVLTHDRVYYINVRARNVLGFEGVGSSPGTRIDASAPEVRSGVH